MSDQAGLEHGGVEVIDRHEHIGVGLAHGVSRVVVEQ